MAGVFLKRGDGVDKSLERSHGAAMKPQETMLEQVRLNGKGGFVDKCQPSQRRDIRAFVEGHPGFRQRRGPS